MTNKTVTLFLIEDDDVDAIAIKRCFRNARIGNPVVRARDGQEALDMLEEDRVEAPYIILLDLKMPRISGLDFLEIIRNDPKYHKNVVFVLTTSDDEKDICSSYEKHIAGYFLKDALGEGILNLVNVLDGYWRIVQLPD